MGKSNRRAGIIYLFKKYLSNKKILFIVLAIIVAILISIGLIIFSNISKKDSNKTAELASKSLTLANEKIAKLDGQLGGAPSKEDSDKVISELSKLAKDDTDNGVKLVYINKMIEIYTNSGEFNLALPLAEQAEQIKPTAITAANLAFVYGGLSDFTKEAQFYQTAADRSEKSASSTTNSPYNDYLILKREAEAKIK